LGWPQLQLGLAPLAYSPSFTAGSCLAASNSSVDAIRIHREHARGIRSESASCRRNRETLVNLYSVAGFELASDFLTLRAVTVGTRFRPWFGYGSTSATSVWRPTKMA
jgi:hypothetical protein